jgi:hypothetical protein
MSENYFETKESMERVKFLLKEYGCPDLLNEASDAGMLDRFIHNYNWDDGLEVPYFVGKHKNCELGTALKMFYFAQGTDMLEEGYRSELEDDEWVSFIDYLYKRIAESDFGSGKIEFKFPDDERTKEDIRKAGWSKVFVEDIIIQK